MASVEFRSVTKAFGGFTAVDHVDLKIGDGEFVCLLGPSGCGKTTSLRMIAGLETPTSGQVLIGEKDVTGLHPKDRQISMVFQDYALYPHMNLADNIAYPLKVRGESVEKRHGRAREVADVLKIGELLNRLPSQISGGQQQRTSLARALVYPSRVYLFDEPLSNLDAKLRLEARGFLNHLQRDMGMTAVYVTHDQAEAMALATRIAVMDRGKIVQYAPPIEIYRRPATTFVANFVGNPPMNLVPVTARAEGANVVLSADGITVQALPLSGGLKAALAHGTSLTLGVRPEHLSVVAAEGGNTISGKLFANENMGPESLVTMERVDASRVTARIFTDDHVEVGEKVRFGFSAEHVTLFDGEGKRIPRDGGDAAVNFDVHVTRADQARDPYFYIPFEVPEGTTRIDVTMAYPQAEDCVVDLGCFDPRMTAYPSSPESFRGWSGGARDRFFIATDDATPGYVHGPIPAGRWNVILGLYKVPAEGADVHLTIALDSGRRALTPPPARTFPVRTGAGWYRGDLHCHTYHSDARGAPEVLHVAARQAGLDFLAIADHNTTTQRRYFHPHSSPELVFVRGMEVTTAVGHANVYGVDDWIDFRMTKPSDAHVLERLVHERGGLLSVNHDKPTIPWDYELPRIDCMEVWQSTWMAWNWVSLGRYQQRLASGLRISAIGGSDFHQPVTLQPEGPLVLARPTTVLWMEDLSEDNVLGAMKAGRGYITESPSGPHLEISIDEQPMGSAVTRKSLLRGRAKVRGAAGDLLHWIDASGVVGEQEILGDDWELEIALLDGASGFVRAEIVAQASREKLVQGFAAEFEGRELPWELTRDQLANEPIRRAISNPVYIE